MRHPWLMLLAVVAASDVTPEIILARRLEQKALFAQRMGRLQVAQQELEIVQLLRPVRSERVEGHKGEKP